MAHYLHAEEDSPLVTGFPSVDGLFVLPSEVQFLSFDDAVAGVKPGEVWTDPHLYHSFGLSNSNVSFIRPQSVPSWTNASVTVFSVCSQRCDILPGVGEPAWLAPLLSAIAFVNLDKTVISSLDPDRGIAEVIFYTVADPSQRAAAFSNPRPRSSITASPESMIPVRVCVDFRVPVVHTRVIPSPSRASRLDSPRHDDLFSSTARSFAGDAVVTARSTFALASAAAGPALWPTLVAKALAKVVDVAIALALRASPVDDVPATRDDLAAALSARLCFGTAATALLGGCARTYFGAHDTFGPAAAASVARLAGGHAQQAPRVAAVHGAPFGPSQPTTVVHGDVHLPLYTVGGQTYTAAPIAHVVPPPFGRAARPPRWGDDGLHNAAGVAAHPPTAPHTYVDVVRSQAPSPHRAYVRVAVTVAVAQCVREAIARQCVAAFAFGATAPLEFTTPADQQLASPVLHISAGGARGWDRPEASASPCSVAHVTPGRVRRARRSDASMLAPPLEPEGHTDPSLAPLLAPFPFPVVAHVPYVVIGVAAGGDVGASQDEDVWVCLRRPDAPPVAHAVLASGPQLAAALGASPDGSDDASYDTLMHHRRNAFVWVRREYRGSAPRADAIRGRAAATEAVWLPLAAVLAVGGSLEVASAARHHAMRPAGAPTAAAARLLWAPWAPTVASCVSYRDAVLSVSLACGWCGRSTVDAAVVFAQRRWHRDCIRCAATGKPIAAMGDAAVVRVADADVPMLSHSRPAQPHAQQRVALVSVSGWVARDGRGETAVARSVGGGVGQRNSAAPPAPTVPAVVRSTDVPFLPPVGLYPLPPALPLPPYASLVPLSPYHTAAVTRACGLAAPYKRLPQQDRVVVRAPTAAPAGLRLRTAGDVTHGGGYDGVTYIEEDSFLAATNGGTHGSESARDGAHSQLTRRPARSAAVPGVDVSGPVDTAAASAMLDTAWWGAAREQETQRAAVVWAHPRQPHAHPADGRHESRSAPPASPHHESPASPVGRPPSSTPRGRQPQTADTPVLRGASSDAVAAGRRPVAYTMPVDASGRPHPTATTAVYVRDDSSPPHGLVTLDSTSAQTPRRHVGDTGRDYPAPMALAHTVYAAPRGASPPPPLSPSWAGAVDSPLFGARSSQTDAGAPERNVAARPEHHQVDGATQTVGNAAMPPYPPHPYAYDRDDHDKRQPPREAPASERDTRPHPPPAVTTITITTGAADDPYLASLPRATTAPPSATDPPLSPVGGAHAPPRAVPLWMQGLQLDTANGPLPVPSAAATIAPLPSGGSVRCGDDVITTVTPGVPLYPPPSGAPRPDGVVPLMHASAEVGLGVTTTESEGVMLGDSPTPRGPTPPSTPYLHGTMVESSWRAPRGSADTAAGRASESRAGYLNYESVPSRPRLSSDPAGLRSAMLSMRRVRGGRGADAHASTSLPPPQEASQARGGPDYGAIGAAVGGGSAYTGDTTVPSVYSGRGAGSDVGGPTPVTAPLPAVPPSWLGGTIGASGVGTATRASDIPTSGRGHGTTWRLNHDRDPPPNHDAVRTLPSQSSTVVRTTIVTTHRDQPISPQVAPVACDPVDVALGRGGGSSGGSKGTFRITSTNKAALSKRSLGWSAPGAYTLFS